MVPCFGKLLKEIFLLWPAREAIALKSCGVFGCDMWSVRTNCKTSSSSFICHWNYINIYHRSLFSWISDHHFDVFIIFLCHPAFSYYVHLNDQNHYKLFFIIAIVYNVVVTSALLWSHFLCFLFKCVVFSPALPLQGSMQSQVKVETGSFP